MIKDFYKQVLRNMGERLFIIFIVVALLFITLMLRLYSLQIIHHEEYESNLRATIQRKIDVDAPRGLVFDRYGRPIALNQPTYVLNIDQGVKMTKEELNDMLLRLIRLLKVNGDQYVDEVPLTQTKPFEYRFSENTRKQFIRLLPFKNDDELEKAYNYSPSELFEYVRGPEVFNIDPAISDDEARAIIALRYELYKYTWSKYKLITVASDVSMETISTIEEKHREFLGVIADVKPVRYYPEGEVLGHIVGYTRKITASQFETMEKYGYEKDDIVGQMGVEQTLENELRGVKGSEIVEVDNRGRKVRTVERDNPTHGNNIFLTIDLELQKKTYDIIEQQLTAVIIERLKGGTKDIKAVTGKEVLYSIVESNGISFTEIKKAPQGTKQYEINEKMKQEFAEMNEYQKSNMTDKQLLLQWMDEGDTTRITERDIMLILHEQGMLQLSDDIVNTFKANRYGNVEGVLIGQMEAGILKPKHMSIDPFSAAAVVVDVHSGEVLSLVGYPSYDPNQMITNFNEYYPLLADDADKRRLLIDRAMRTAKAPGSTFKMITAIAGLEEGIVTPYTQIYDTGVFTKAGTPYPRCWIRHGHGWSDITRSLEVSCNYYFYDTSFRLGQGSTVPFQGIQTLTNYVKMFGLDQKSGIELSETEPTISSPDVVVKKELSIALWNVKNMADEKKKPYIDSIIQRISKGYIPWADPYDQSLEGKIQREIQYEFKRKIETPIAEALEPTLGPMLEDVLVNLASTLEQQQQQIIDQVAAGVMSDPAQRVSLRNKTKQNLTKELKPSLQRVINPVVDKTLKPLMDQQLKDAYEHAYTVAYRRVLRNSKDGELIAELKRRMENAREESRKSEGNIKDAISGRIVENIVEQIIERSMLEWSDGITIRTAIGQGNSAFTPVQVAKYTAAIANRKNVFDLRIVDAVENVKEDGQIIEKESIIKNELNVKESTMDVIHEGMLRVTNGKEGTARTIYNDFPIPVGGKTGTAQDGGHEHASFAGFAPYDDPQVAIYTTIYNADGAGRYNSTMSKEILKAYFGLEQKYKETTLDNIFTN